MSAWSSSDFRRDISDQVAEWNDAMRAEATGSPDDWPDDDRPTAREIAAEEAAARRGGWEW
jgi:hypothetical protein